MAQKSVLNLTYADFQFEYNFINLVKRWQRPLGVVADRNALDYPTEAVTGQALTGYFPETATYVARWLGSGSFSCAGGSKTNASSGVYTGGGADGSVVTNGRFTFTQSAKASATCTIKGTTMSSLVVCLASEEALLDGGDILRPRFKELIAEFNPDSLRFMDMQMTNFSLAGRDWVDMPSEDRLTYTAGMYYPDKYVGVMTGTNNYTASSYTGMPVAYEHGEIFQGVFENANDSTTCTLDSGGRGAKSLGVAYAADYPKTVAIGGSDTNSIHASPKNYTIVYDKYYDQLMFWRGDTELGAAPMGYPIPVLVDMCNELGVPGYFCIPYYASDVWITSFGNYLVTNYLPNHDFVKIAFGNEPWNGLFALFRQAARAGTLLMGLNGGNKANTKAYIGMRFREIYEILFPIFDAAGYGSKLKMVLEWDQADGSSVANLETQVGALLLENTSTATTGTIEGNHTPAYYLSGDNAPKNFADYFSVALYIYNKRIRLTDDDWDDLYDILGNIDDVLEAADNWATGTAASRALALAFMYTNELASGGSTYARVTATDGSGLFKNLNDFITPYGLKVCYYEANKEGAAPSASWCTGKSIDSSYGGLGGKIDDLLTGWYNSASYERTWALLLNNFYSYSQSESFALYAMGNHAPWNCFPLQSETSTLGGDTMQEGLGNWRAHCNRNNGRRRYLLTTS